MFLCGRLLLIQTYMFLHLEKCEISGPAQQSLAAKVAEIRDGLKRPCSEYAAQSHNLLRSVEMCHLKGQHSNVSNMFKELVLYVLYISMQIFEMRKTGCLNIFAACLICFPISFSLSSRPCTPSLAGHAPKELKCFHCSGWGPSKDVA